MTANAYLLWIILMAIAITTILVVGTLAAAGLLHRPQPSQPDERELGEATAPRESTPEAAAGRSPVLIDALIPLGAGLSSGLHLSAPVGEGISGNLNDPRHGRAA